MPTRSPDQSESRRIRKPLVAGQFYPADPETCRRQIEVCLGAGPSGQDFSAEHVRESRVDGLMLGAIVPHAGWMCSGGVAGRAFRELRRAPSPERVVLFGGVHRYRGRTAAVYGSGEWLTPIGRARVDEAFCTRLLDMSELFADDPSAHDGEHSIEVQLPFLVSLLPDARIVPIMVPIAPQAVPIGETVARLIAASRGGALVVGTTDLTHYGPNYGFTPWGTGKESLARAKFNDARFIELMCALRAGDLVPEAATHHNACNAGAATATVACCAALGATGGTLLEHTTSREVLRCDSPDSVGYAAVLFAAPNPTTVGRSGLFR
ncbi:MAG: AmmeMemoRadiSam system protein B [Phycisphaerales bacterium]|nr:AmmeMemoRadiSam system protein B [Phycisphaerales bacterium]